MTRVGTLWGVSYQRQTRVILSVAAVNEVQLEQPQWSFQDRPADFTAKFPYGKIPAFEGTDGFKLTEGATIAHYLSSIGTKAKLLGSDAKENAVVDQWVHFAEHEIGVPSYRAIVQIRGFAEFNRKNFDLNNERLIRALDYVESHLATRPSGYVALDTLTLADYVLASVVHVAAGYSLGSAERAQYKHIFAHHAKVTGDERVKQFWGTDNFVDVQVTEPQTVAST